MSGKRSTNGVVKPISDNEQLSEVGNRENQPHSGQSFRHFGRPKKGILAGRGVPNFGHTLFMAALAYPFQKNGICTRTRGAQVVHSVWFRLGRGGLSENFRPFVVENRLRASFSRRIYAIRVQK